jgi:uncharacterized membrane protein YidH (DUF202 family)
MSIDCGKLMSASGPDAYVFTITLYVASALSAVIIIIISCALARYGVASWQRCSYVDRCMEHTLECVTG